MKKKTFLVVALASLIAGVAMGGFYDEIFVVPNKAYVPSATVLFFIDGEPWANETELDWGYVYPGETIVSILAVENIGDTNCTVTMNPSDLPSGWTLIWDKNGHWCNITETLSGDLAVYVSDTAVQGQWYSWNMTIIAET